MQLNSIIIKAACFAAKAHEDQRRKGSGIPYIEHPLGVAEIVANEGGVCDEITLTAALLHDTVEDTDVTLDQIQEIFGWDLAHAVAEITDNKTARKQHQIDHSRWISKRARTIKLADKLHKLRSFATGPPNWDRERIQGYFVWSAAIIDSIRGTNRRLEDALDVVFACNITLGDETFPALPDCDRVEFLKQYMESMRVAVDGGFNPEVREN
jgi:(p)ppGpp synthase/HD superfamily hydrolase